MVNIENNQLEKDYTKAKELIKKKKYIQAVLHLENLLKRPYSEEQKNMVKDAYKDIIHAYRSINNKTRADYYLTKAIGVFGTFNELDDEETANPVEPLLEETANLEGETNSNDEIIEENNLENVLGENVVLRTVEDFEILKKPYKIKANDTNEVNFNNIFVEIFTAVESKKYFGYFKLNLNKLNDVVSNGVDNIEKDELIRIKWEIKTLLALIEEHNITSFDTLYALEFEAMFDGKEEEKSISVNEFEDSTSLEAEVGQTFSFSEEAKTESKEFVLENSAGTSEEIINGIDKIVEKNREIFEEHNTILELDPGYSENVSEEETTSIVDSDMSNEEIADEIMSNGEAVLTLNMEASSETAEPAQNETVILKINTEKVKENNLEVSKVKDVVLEVLENLRKADLDVFSELKAQSEERAETVGLEREKKGLLSGLEGMLEIKFGVASLDIVPEIKKINELERLYEVKEKVLATRNFNDVEKLIEDSIQSGASQE